MEKYAIVELIYVFEDVNEDEDDDVRIHFANVLAEMKESRAIEPMIEVLHDKAETEDVRESAAKALKEITGQDFGQDPVKWQKWWEVNKKKTVIQNENELRQKKE